MRSNIKGMSDKIENVEEMAVIEYADSNSDIMEGGKPKNRINVVKYLDSAIDRTKKENIEFFKEYFN